MVNLLRIHRWAAVAILVPLMVQTLSGVLLVHRWDMARWLDPAGMTRQSASADLSPGEI